MSTSENDEFKHLRARQTAAVQCIEALQQLNSASQVQVLLTAIAFYGLQAHLGEKDS